MSSFMSLFGKGKNTLAIARSLYFNGKAQAELPHWYHKGLIANDFRARQTLIMVHVWMLHRRLLLEGSKGTTLQECMFDELWDDTSIRIRNAGIQEIMVNKRLGEVQAYSFRSCLELDQAMAAPSEDEKLEEIGGALWRGVFQRNNDIEPDHVLEMADYVKSEANSFLELPSIAFLEGRIAFSSVDQLWAGNGGLQKVVKGGKYVHVGRSSSSNRSGAAGEEKDGGVLDEPHASPAGGQEPIWRSNLASNGTVYYYNTHTRETTWEKPAEFVDLIGK